MRYGLVPLALIVSWVGPPPVDAGKIHLKYGYAIEADDWWEADGLLWYTRGGTRSVRNTADQVKTLDLNLAFTNWDGGIMDLIVRPMTIQPGQGIEVSGYRVISCCVP